jgi:CMP-N,N'-diacetyllegionaminic acid synthase
MRVRPRIFVVIPARGGSQGIPGKNLITLKGRPLLEWTCDFAKRLSNIDDFEFSIVVSSDSSEILRVGENNGITNQGIRPAHLSSSTAKTADVLEYESSKLDYAPDYIMLLQPTCPFRRFRTIQKALQIISTNEDVSSVLSVTNVEGNHPQRMNFFDPETERVRPAFGVDEHDWNFEPRQLLSPLYLRSGELYLMTPRVLSDCNSLVGGKVCGVETYYPFNINIDTQQDLELAEFVHEDYLNEIYC